MSHSAWNKDIPVEKSQYIDDESVYILNRDNFVFEKSRPTMIDLFCGAGGFSVGAELVGFQSILGVDHLKPAMDTWMFNHAHSVGCLGDIGKIDANEFKMFFIERGVSSFDLITGGVPCQGFSRANRKHTDFDSRNFLFLEYMRFVKVFNPKFIILENVSGMRTTASGYFEREIKSSMEELGYSVSVKLVNAADYGVPQVRQRLIFVGVRKNCGLMNVYDFPVGKYRNHYNTVYDAISDLPPLLNGESKTEYESNPVTDYQKLMRGFGDIEIKQPDHLYNHAAPNHSDDVLRMIESTKPGYPMYKKFKQRIRLRYDLPSPTQLAGGIRPQFQFGHPEQVRGLSIRERARIQSFPDSYVFCGGITQERVQTGNAVPPLLIYNLLKPIYDNILSRC